MSQYQRNEPDLTKYEPLPGEPALEDALWSTGLEFGISELIFYNSQIDSLAYPLFSTDFQESTACNDADYAALGFDPPETSDLLNIFSPIPNPSSLLVKSTTPSILHGELPNFPTTTTSPPSETNDIIGVKELPNSFPITRRNDLHYEKRRAKRTDNHTVGISPLHERFVQVMERVRQLPSGQQSKNALFTPFFTKNGRLYVCLLCPTKAAKTISNRTQIIQHITGWHGESRPFACPSCPHTAIRKADLEKHLKEVHNSSRHHCPKCSKSYSNQRNLRRHEKNCLISA